MSKVILVTGASSGMGKSAAFQLKSQGHIVYGAARRLEEMNDLKDKGVKTLSLDITNEASVKACIDEILKNEGRIDVLINNAGYGSYGAVEDVSIEEAKRQFDVNLFGLARITQLVLPAMRQQKSGRIVNISSMGGKVYTPMGAWYHATKHALEGWSDCLRLELKEHGIDVVIVEPGGIKTPWGQIAVDHLRKTSGKGAYSNLANSVANNMEKMYSSSQLTDVDVLGAEIAKAATVASPKTRFAKGYMAKFSILSRRLISDRLFDKIIMGQMRK